MRRPSAWTLHPKPAPAPTAQPKPWQLVAAMRRARSARTRSPRGSASPCADGRDGVHGEMAAESDMVERAWMVEMARRERKRVRGVTDCPDCGGWRLDGAAGSNGYGTDEAMTLRVCHGPDDGPESPSRCGGQCDDDSSDLVVSPGAAGRDGAACPPRGPPPGLPSAAAGPASSSAGIGGTVGDTTLGGQRGQRPTMEEDRDAEDRNRLLNLGRHGVLNLNLEDPETRRGALNLPLFQRGPQGEHGIGEVRSANK